MLTAVAHDTVALDTPAGLVCGAIRYRLPSHSDLPHVVKFSGGRSSAAMAISLARAGALNPERGDVVLFANTTAEHPATYEFAAKVCDEIEAEHGIPCFWYEFCTVEDMTRSGWSRVPSFRLVRRVKASESDDLAKPGYRDDGTAFEEMVSLKTMIPNRSLRFCTQQLKVLPGISVLSYWLGGGPGPAHAGHHYEDRLASAADDAERYAGKAMTTAEIESAREFVHAQCVSRPAQRWEDFTTVPTGKPDEGPRPMADLAGKHGAPVGYVTVMGLRADEKERVTKAQIAEVMYGGASTAKCRHDSHPAGEVIAAPLCDHGADKQMVNEFWEREGYDLGLDRDGRLGNCVYCFMKGESVLQRLAAEENPRRPPPGPAGIKWWANIESKYARRSDEAENGFHSFKFLSLRSASYSDIAVRVQNADAAPRPDDSGIGGGGLHCPAPARTDRCRAALPIHMVCSCSPKRTSPYRGSRPMTRIGTTPKTRK